MTSEEHPLTVPGEPGPDRTAAGDRPAGLEEAPDIRDLAATAARWTCALDVVADPDQRDQRGLVWTDAYDILPATRIEPGVPVVAGWGDLTFTATPRWDDHELETLWLRPIEEATARPRIPDRWLPTVLGELAAAGTSGDAVAGVAEQLAELCATVNILADAVAGLRLIIAATLAELERMPPKRRRALLNRPVIHQLYATARQTPPRPDA